MKRAHVACLLFLGFLGLSGDGLCSTTVTCPCDADSYESAQFKDDNYGSSEELWAGNFVSNFWNYTLARFDLSSVPANATIESARPYVYVFGVINSGGDSRCVRISSTWNENTVTWNNSPSSTSDYNTTSITSSGWKYYSIKSMVRNWVDGTNPNHGVRLTLQRNASLLRIKSKESSNKPYLQVTYSVPDSTPPSPDPSEWQNEPQPETTTSISMQAVTATDSTSPPDQYYFDCTNGGHDSGWQASRDYGDTGLSVNTRYSYRVKTRDDSSNETGYSPTRSCYTFAAVPPAPSVGNPTASTLDVTPSRGTNPSYTDLAVYNSTRGQYLRADGTSNGTTPVWQTESRWGSLTVGGLAADTLYSFKIRARNGDGHQTGLSTEAQGRTSAQGPTPPTRPQLSVQSTATSAEDFSVSWTSSASHTSYQLQESTSSSFSNPTTFDLHASQIAKTFRHNVSTDTRYYYRIRALNSGNGLSSGWSNTDSVLVSSKYPEIISGPIATPNPAPIDQEVSFDVSAVGDNLVYHWEFGDTSGVSSDVRSPSHSYQSAGIYVVTVTVTDEVTGKTDRGSVDVTVRSDDDPAFPPPVPYYWQGLTDWCAVACIHMLSSYYGDPIPPETSLKIASKARGKGLGSGSVRKVLNSYFPDKVNTYQPFLEVGAEKLKNKLDELLDAQKAVMVNMHSEDFDFTGHSIIVVGRTPDAAHYWIHDPSGAAIRDWLGYSLPFEERHKIVSRQISSDDMYRLLDNWLTRNAELVWISDASPSAQSRATIDIVDCALVTGKPAQPSTPPGEARKYTGSVLLFDGTAPGGQYFAQCEFLMPLGSTHLWDLTTQMEGERYSGNRPNDSRGSETMWG